MGAFKTFAYHDCTTSMVIKKKIINFIISEEEYSRQFDHLLNFWQMNLLATLALQKERIS